MCLRRVIGGVCGWREKCPDLGILVYMVLCFGVLVACAYFSLAAHAASKGMVLISLGAMFAIGCIICQVEERRNLMNERRGIGGLRGQRGMSPQSPPPLYESPPPSYRSASVDLGGLEGETNPLL